MPRPSLSEIDEIRQQMSLLRLGLHQDASAVVNEAERVFDWKAQITQRPWLAVGVAAAVGYLIVPRRRRRPEAVAADAARQAVAAVAPPPDPPRERSGGGLFWPIAKMVFSIGGPIALQAAQSYAIAWLEQSLIPTQRPAPTPVGPGPGRPRPDPAAPVRH